MSEIHAATGPRTEVLFFDGFDDLDSVGPFEILVAAGFPVTPVRSPGSQTTVRSAHGLALTITDELGTSADLVVVPGGGWRDGAAVGVRAQCQGELPRRLAALHERGTVLASVCTGAMLLEAAGVLAGRPAVTNRIAIQDLRDAGAEVLSEARVVDDGDVVTCGGPAAGLDLAVHLVGRYRGAAAGEQAAERLEHQPVGPVVTSRAD